MRAIPLLLSTVFALATTACGGGRDTAATVSIYKSLGSLQCTGGGLTVSALQFQLAAAGIQAIAASCGLDGNVYPAICGASDGHIGIFNVPPQDVQLAVTLGFAALSTLPAAVPQACS